MIVEEIPEALRVYEEAFEGDPLEHYMKDTPVRIFQILTII